MADKKQYADKKQHVDIQRKIALRQRLLEKAGKLTGACYVPFIGEGDIASALYSEKKIYGADIDPAMVETAKARLPGADIIVADCDKLSFKKSTTTFSLGDFDSYFYPYQSFRNFFKGAKIGSQCVLFFTDGQRQAVHRCNSYTDPNGEKVKFANTAEMRPTFNFYFNRVVLPWFKEYIKPWHIVYITKYLRSGSMCYWGAIISRAKVQKVQPKKDTINGTKFDESKKQTYLDLVREGKGRMLAAREVGVNIKTVDRHMASDKEFKKAVSLCETEANQNVENALYKAATSGNVTAIQVWLYNRNPARWADRRSVRLAGEGGGPIEVKEIDAKGILIDELNRLAARAGKAEGDKQSEPEGS